jgi:hypothetical protein
MLELFGIPIGSVAQVATFLTAFTGLVWAFLKFGLKWHGQTLSAETDLKRVGVDAEAILRTHFANRLKTLEDRLERSEQAHEDCLKDNDAFRRRVRELEDHLEGVYRMLVQTSAEKVIEMGTEVFPLHVIELAKRTVSYTRGAGS